MDKKIGFIILALVITLGIGVGVSLAQSPEDDQYVAIRAHIADTGCEFVSLDDFDPEQPDIVETEKIEWFDSVAGSETPSEEYYQSTTHTFQLNNVFPGFGYDIPRNDPCDEVCYLLYFVRNEDMDDPSTIGIIDVQVYTLDSGNPVPCSWVDVKPYDDTSWNILPDIISDVNGKIDSLPTGTEAKTAMKTAFANGCLQEGDVLQRGDLGEGDSSTWGCYGISVKVPFEEYQGHVPQGDTAYVTVTISPTENRPAVYFMEAPEVDEN